MVKLFVYLLTLVFAVGIGAIYGGLGWVVAWILEKGLSIDVNYQVFVWVAIGIYLLKLLPFIIVRLIAEKAEKDFDKRWNL